jgi:hypothetical protein
MPPGNSYEDEWFLHNTRWILAGFFWFLLGGAVFRNFPVIFWKFPVIFKLSVIFWKFPVIFEKKIPAPPKNLLPHFSKRLSPRPIKKTKINRNVLV